MSNSTISDSLRMYIADEILDGQDIELENSTPLLEWGILNSMEITRLVNFIEKEFGIEIPGDKIVIENLKDIDAITKLILEIRE
jgi:acyl carrier protein